MSIIGKAQVVSWQSVIRAVPEANLKGTGFNSNIEIHVLWASGSESVVRDKLALPLKKECWSTDLRPTERV